jgi:lysozyme
MARKKRKTKAWWQPLIFVAVVALLLYYHKQVVRYAYKGYRIYRSLVHPVQVQTGMISYPAGYSIHGIDVSRWQDVIDWSQLKAKTCDGDTVSFKFAFIKATEGVWIEDPMFADNWKQARRNRIIRGAYHYYLPDVNPYKQAKNFISSVTLKKGDLPPVVDVEETRNKSRKELVAGLKIYIAEVQKHYGVKPIIYSNINFIDNYLADDFDDHRFWVAHYYREELVINKDVDWLFWQHSDKAGMIGCGYHVDVNVFNGSARDLERILIR